MENKWEKIGKPVYTVEDHVRRLIALMAKDEPCNFCPPAKGLSMGISPTEDWDTDLDYPCRICREFIGLDWCEDEGRWTETLPGCPCYALDAEEAIDRTFKALSAYQREMVI